MDPVTMALISSLLTGAGGLLGKKGQQPIDPEMLKRLFGPNATAEETQALFALLKNSPAFAAMMSGNAMQGANMANAAAQRTAMSGAGGSPIAAFLAQAGRGYGATLNRNAQGGLWEQALRAAQQNIGQRMQAFTGSKMQQQTEQPWNRMIGASLLNAGATGFGGILSTPKVPGLPGDMATGSDPWTKFFGGVKP